jgi:hypothetical protein
MGKIEHIEVPAADRDHLETLVRDRNMRPKRSSGELGLCG